MEPLEKLQILQLAVKILADIENLSIDDIIKTNLIHQVLSIINYEDSKNNPQYSAESKKKEKTNSKSSKNKICEVVENDLVVEKVVTKQSQKIVLSNQQKIIMNSLQRLGGQAVRSEIIKDTGLAPNIVSSVLNKLFKSKKIDKLPIENSDIVKKRSGRGLKPEYIYVLLKEEEQTNV